MVNHVDHNRHKCCVSNYVRFDDEGTRKPTEKTMASGAGADGWQTVERISGMLRDDHGCGWKNAIRLKNKCE
jgi:hypothetical protein